MDIDTIIDLKRKAEEVVRFAENLELDIGSNPFDPVDVEQSIQDLEEVVAELKSRLADLVRCQ